MGLGKGEERNPRNSETESSRRSVGYKRAALAKKEASDRDRGSVYSFAFCGVPQLKAPRGLLERRGGSACIFMVGKSVAFRNIQRIAGERIEEGNLLLSKAVLLLVISFSNVSLCLHTGCRFP